MFSSKGIKDLKVNIKKIKGSSIDNNINNVQEYEEIDYNIESIPMAVSTGIGMIKESLNAAKNNIYDKINSEAAIVYDVTNDEVLFEKNGYELFEPASMTKVITAYIVMKYGNINDTIEYSKNAINVDGKRKYDYGTLKSSPVADIVKKGNKISAQLFNSSRSSKKLSKCYVVKFSIENDFYKDHTNYNAFNINGITNEMAITDVIQILGTPSHFYSVSDTSYYLDYFISKKDRRNGITVYINPVDDVILSVEFSYYK